MTDVIYEDPECLLPHKARWFAHDSFGNPLWFPDKPVIIDGGWGFSHWWYAHNTYAVTSPWRESLRRIIRLDDPDYYVADNPHTNAEGFLLHDGGPMPEWCQRKIVEFVQEKYRPCLKQQAPANFLAWTPISHYRIVEDDPACSGCRGASVTHTCGEGSEDREAGEGCPDCEKLIGERDEAEELGTELAEAVGKHFGIDVGEHSSCNDPRRAALDIFNGEFQIPGRGPGEILPRKNPALDRIESIARRLGEASGDTARLIQILSTEYVRLRSLEEVLYDYDSIRAHMDPETAGRTRSMHVSDTIHAIQGAWADAMIDQEPDQ